MTPEGAYPPVRGLVHDLAVAMVAVVAFLGGRTSHLHGWAQATHAVAFGTAWCVVVATRGPQAAKPEQVQP